LGFRGSKIKKNASEKELAGKVALITGAAGGIGSATANKFLSEGCCVVLTDIDTSALEAKKEEFIKNLEKMLFIQLLWIVTSEKEVKKSCF
jgi:NADP-dependent 3-hydroxy acid dehydrogenase YdfG